MRTSAKWLQLTTTALVLVVLGFIGVALVGHQGRWVPYLVPLLALLGILLRFQEHYRGFAFTAWVLAFVAAGMVWPQAFDRWFGYDLRVLIVPLVQVIMFG